jgi:hypothetical protein
MRIFEVLNKTVNAYSLYIKNSININQIQNSNCNLVCNPNFDKIINRDNIKTVIFKANGAKKRMSKLDDSLNLSTYENGLIDKNQFNYLISVSECNRLILEHSAIAVLDPLNNNRVLLVVKTTKSDNIKVFTDKYMGINELQLQKVIPIGDLCQNKPKSFLSTQIYSWLLGPNETLENNKFIQVIDLGSNKFNHFYYNDLEFLDLHKTLAEGRIYSFLRNADHTISMNGYFVSHIYKVVNYNKVNYNKELGIISSDNFIKFLQNYEEYKEKYNLILAKYGGDLGL